MSILNVNQIQPVGGGNTITVGASDFSTVIVTATNGFTSGTGTPVQISVVGSTLTFTVAGIGSTSLTLL